MGSSSSLLISRFSSTKLNFDEVLYRLAPKAEKTKRVNGSPTATAVELLKNSDSGPKRRSLNWTVNIINMSTMHRTKIINVPLKLHVSEVINAWELQGNVEQIDGQLIVELTSSF